MELTALAGCSRRVPEGARQRRGLERQAGAPLGAAGIWRKHPGGGGDQKHEPRNQNDKAAFPEAKQANGLSKRGGGGGRKRLKARNMAVRKWNCLVLALPLALLKAAAWTPASRQR